MTIRVKVLAVAAVVALAGSAVLLLPSARGSGEPEDPFWSVAAKRLSSGTKKMIVEGVSGVETTIHGTVKSKEVEIRCKTSKLTSALLEGSEAKHDGKVLGTLELSTCHLWAKEGETFKEKAECEVPTIKSKSLIGALWLEGTKAAAGKTTAIVYEPTELTGGKPVIAEVTIKGCATFEGKPLLEGSFAEQLLPQNEEFTYMRWTLPKTAITTVWKPASEEKEETVGLKLEGTTSTLTGEFQAETEVEPREKFGGGVEPLAGIEAPYWRVKGARLEVGKEAAVTTGAITEPLKIRGQLFKKEIEIRCKKVAFKEAALVGSLGQRDGKFVVKAIEFSECTLFAKEGEVFKEQKACEVPNFSSAAVSGRLWFEGTKAERKTKGVLVLGPESGNTMSPAIKSKAGETCGFATSGWAIDGQFAFHLNPEEAEVETINFSSSGSGAIHVWQSAEQEAEEIVELLHDETECSTVVKTTVFFTMPELPVKLSGGGVFKFTHV